MFAFLIALASVIASFLFYSKLKSRKERTMSIGSMTQSLTLLVAFVMPIYYLRDLSDIEAVGHGISTSIIIVIYGAAINIFCKIIARFQA